MLHFIRKIIEVKPYKVTCLFNTKEIREIDLEPTLKKFSTSNVSQLKDHNYFQTVKLDSYGTLCWENGVDFCPDVLYSISILVEKKK